MSTELFNACCRVDGNSGATQGAYFHAHRNQDGMWATAAAMPRCREDSGRPAAYVALNGEALVRCGDARSTWICRNVFCRRAAMLCQIIVSKDQ
jgi:hypothetical protein